MVVLFSEKEIIKQRNTKLCAKALNYTRDVMSKQLDCKLKLDKKRRMEHSELAYSCRVFNGTETICTNFFDSNSKLGTLTRITVMHFIVFLINLTCFPIYLYFFI